MRLTVPLKKYELTLGFLYLALELLLLPQVLGLLNLTLQLPPWGMNFLFFCVNFICVTVIFHRFLLDSFRIVIAYPWRLLRYSGQGLLIYFVGNYLISLAILIVQPDFSNINDASIAQMADENRVLITLGTVVLVPVVEECLYRGLIFRGLFDRSKVLAYTISTVCFAVIHVLGYIGTAKPITLILCFVQYLPAGIALAYAYHKSDTIWTPILMHMAINQIGMSIGG